VDEHRHADRCAVLKEGDDAGIVEVKIADMIADLDARVARCAASIDLGAGGICVL